MRGVGIFYTRNTTMLIRKLLLATVSVAAISPAISYASPENAALKACAKAFASSLGAGSTAPAFKLVYNSQSVGALADYYSAKDFTFFLMARDPKTGSTLARATCSADTSGMVIALTATPLETPPALAATL
jgi:hypothetical protein